MFYKQILALGVALLLCCSATGCVIVDSDTVATVSEVASEAVDGVVDAISKIDVKAAVLSQEASPGAYVDTATANFHKYLGDSYSCRYRVYDKSDSVKSAVAPNKSVTYSVDAAGRYVSVNPYTDVDGNKAMSVFGKHFYLEYEDTWYACENMLFSQEALPCNIPDDVTYTEYLLNTVCTADNYRKSTLETNFGVDVKSVDAYICDDNVYVYIYDKYDKLSQVVNVTTGTVYVFEVWYAPEDIVKMQNQYIK